jgi:phosphopantothenoylcysteine decarboxylase/phosphopantothenate--cysteine ligase
MRDAVMACVSTSDVIIMAAAVADYRPSVVATEKIKKTQGELSLTLVKNPDILGELGAIRREAGRTTPILVGFAVETTELVRHAREKLSRKGCDMIVANLAVDGFEGSDNRVTLVRADEAEALPRMAKRAVAERILDGVKVLGA